MPATHTVTITPRNPQHTVNRNGVQEPITILKEEGEKVYVNYTNLQKRFDEWIPRSELHPIIPQPGPSNVVKTVPQKRKRKPTEKARASGSRGLSENGDDEGGETESVDVAEGQPQQVVMTEEDYDIQHHKAQIGAVRNFDKVHFGEWLIKTWYFSPYPLTENEDPEPVSTANSSATRIPGVSRARAEDLFAGGLHKSHGQHRSVLWVCEMCFKYMTDGLSWESHKKICTVLHPPGRKVYQRGAHTIWEVDGAKAKLYCQNLSLFGKLFIDIKTLYFDLDNFMFYILTDAARDRDHMMGYFCREKQSFDDYNLACITTLPPYQKQGYGMLMIEFSYELSRRSGKIGTPERPLSDLGLRSYLAYWVATLVRFFRKLLSVLPPGTTQVISTGIAPDLAVRSHEGSEDGVLSPTTQRRRRNTKGWEGEVDDDDGAYLIDIDESINSLRNYVTTANPDGSASTHLQIQCSLSDISRATNLRIEDAAFALNEMGMLKRWGQAPPPVRLVGGSQSSRSGMSSPIRNGNSNGNRRSVSVLGGGSTVAAGDVGEEGDNNGYVILLTREMVEKVADERHVKPPCMKMKYVLL
ncbi:acyl-CoA N-acyltransferase [Marasmius fiardii PR-910]|nr:acyl-CoA N-acyltransferase [Marasmius fiardii PR-910]